MTIVKSDSINQETSTVNQGLLLPLAENGLCHTDKMLKVKHLYSIFCLLLLTNLYTYLLISKLSTHVICKQFSNTVSCQTFKWHPWNVLIGMNVNDKPECMYEWVNKCRCLYPRLWNMTLIKCDSLHSAYISPVKASFQISRSAAMLQRCLHHHHPHSTKFSESLEESRPRRIKASFTLDVCFTSACSCMSTG